MFNLTAYFNLLNEDSVLDAVISVSLGDYLPYGLMVGFGVPRSIDDTWLVDLEVSESEFLLVLFGFSLQAWKD